ncbi:MAG: diguanylate cyclase [Limnochordia bacterium]|jgi:diguanylate cyclase (GGDEF)-like protein|nr:diguanylate cyclase [Bacillota bacterium]NLL07844.1 diguanylate cyclase [Bacillota bacterium]
MLDDIDLGRRQRILIVEDVKLNAQILVNALKDTYDLRVAHNGVEALAMVREEMPDLILLDIIMPEMDGYEVCARLQSDPNTRDIPILFLTALEGDQNEAYGIELGAMDYIRKPFNVPIVKAKIRNHLELKRYKDILKRDSRIDGLTRIPNRRRFDEAYVEERDRARRTKTPLAVLMIDLDRFKLYNDAYGHLQGDDVLRLVAQTLYHALHRPGDLVARWGGEEFVVLLPQTDLEGAVTVAERLRKAVWELEIPHESSPVAKVLTVSIGVAASKAGQPWSYDMLLQWADEAVYRAKAEGRNKVVPYKE